MSESELVSRLIKKLKSDGFRVRTEVSNMGQSADIVATRGKWVTLIEVKTRNWNRAVQQCQAHEQIADYICIAIASNTVPERLIDLAMATGYGVLHYRREYEDFVWVVKPRLNKQVWPPQRRYWAKAHRGIVYAD